MNSASSKILYSSFVLFALAGCKKGKGKSKPEPVPASSQSALQLNRGEKSQLTNIVKLVKNGKPYCTGAIYRGANSGNSWVLTSSSCVSEDFSDLRVQTESSAELYSVHDVSVIGEGIDLAVILIKEEFNADRISIAPSSLDHDSLKTFLLSETTAPPLTLTSYGFEAPSQESVGQRSWQFKTLDVVDEANQLKVSSPSLETCASDVGGPLVIRYQNENQILGIRTSNAELTSETCHATDAISFTDLSSPIVREQLTKAHQEIVGRLVRDAKPRLLDLKRIEAENFNFAVTDVLPGNHSSHHMPICPSDEEGGKKLCEIKSGTYLHYREAKLQEDGPHTLRIRLSAKAGPGKIEIQFRPLDHSDELKKIVEFIGPGMGNLETISTEFDLQKSRYEIVLIAKDDLEIDWLSLEPKP